MATPTALVFRLCDLPIGPLVARFLRLSEREAAYPLYFYSPDYEDLDTLFDEYPAPPDDPSMENPTWQGVYQIVGGTICFADAISARLLPSLMPGQDAAVAWGFRIDLSLDTVIEAFRRYGFTVLGAADIVALAEAADPVLAWPPETVAALRRRPMRRALTWAGFSEEAGLDRFALFCQRLGVTVDDVARAVNVGKLIRDQGWFRSSFALRMAERDPELDAAIRVYLNDGSEEPLPSDEEAAPARDPSVLEEEMHAAFDGWFADPPRDDRTPFLVHADALQERGDPRGELIAMQAGPVDPKRAVAYVRRHADALLGELAPHAGRAARLTWAHGYVFGAQLDSASLTKADPARLLDALLRHPSGRFLRALTVARNGKPTGYGPILGALTRNGPVRLASLELGTGVLPHPDLGNLGRLWAAAPRLLHLTLTGEVRGFEVHSASIIAPHLRSFSLDGKLIEPQAVELFGAPLPALERLTLSLRESSRHRLEPPIFAPLFSATRVPRLRTLALKDCAYIRELLPSLASSPLVAQLTELDLSSPFVDDETVTTLLAHGRAFTHLTRLTVAPSAISPDVAAVLQAVFPNAVAR